MATEREIGILAVNVIKAIELVLDELQIEEFSDCDDGPVVEALAQVVARAILRQNRLSSSHDIEMATQRSFAAIEAYVIRQRHAQLLTPNLAEPLSAIGSHVILIQKNI